MAGASNGSLKADGKLLKILVKSNNASYLKSWLKVTMQVTQNLSLK